MGRNRRAAVAGSFYPADPRRLRTAVEAYLDAAPPTASTPKALILPHAGHVYSGPVAATGYATLRAARPRIERVVLLGPSHFRGLRGFAASSAAGFTTPLGVVPVDRAAVDDVCRLDLVAVDDEAHRREHSLEVHLPFLQVVLDRFTLVPLLAGGASPEEVAEVLEHLWGGSETVVVISSDLSHFHAYDEARARDTRTSAAIEALEAEGVRAEDACGCVPIRGLLTLAARRGMSARVLDLRNSGDTAGGRAEVVGYGAYALAE